MEKLTIIRIVIASLITMYPSDSVQASSLSQSWQKFHGFAGKGLDSFVEKYLKKHIKDVKTVFYPFGGGDITYPFMLFPSLQTLTLVGLEPVGEPEAYKGQNLSPEIPADLSAKEQKSLESLYRCSFFITSQMASSFNHEKGVIPIIVAQLESLKATDIQIHFIEEPTKGVQIAFHRDSQPKSIYYFKADLWENKDLTPLYSFFREKELCGAALLKSTSYIPHKASFSHIRSFITDNASVILQDNSGIPLAYLQEKDFKIHIFGSYKEPYGVEFRGYTQKTLKDLYDIEMPPKVPFCFGYGCGRVPTNLILAIKQAAEEERK